MKIRSIALLLALSAPVVGAYAQQHDNSSRTHDSAPRTHDNSPRPTGQKNR